MTHAELFINVLIGHCFGDYWFQNNWMAQNKSKPGMIGNLACTVHAFIYSITVLTSLLLGTHCSYELAIGLFGIIFLPHWLIDRVGLAGYWMWFKNGEHPWKIFNSGDIIGRTICEYKVEADANLVQKTWYCAFTAFVYIVSDNSLHLLCLWLTILKLL